MRKLLLAALIALAPLAAAAQSLQINRSQVGEVGALVTATDPSGNTGKVILPGAMLADSSGAEKGTASNPLITSAATGSNGQVVGNVASGATDSGNPVKVGAVFNTTPPTYTNGQRGDAQMSPRGATYVAIQDGTGTTLVTVPGSGVDGASNTQGGVLSYARGVLFNGSTWDRAKSITGAIGAGGLGVAAMETVGAPFSHITTNATTTVKSGAGILHRICINTKGATANVATIFDNTAGSGTVIGVLDTTSGVACLVYDVAFATGLTIVTATGTAGDLTVTYR